MSGGIMETDVSGKADTVLTTKGDLATWDTARVRKGVSATNYTGLQADSAIADGLTYGATARSTLTGIGDLCASSAANTLTRIAAGATSGHVLTSTGAGSLPTYQAVAGDANLAYIGEVKLGAAAEYMEQTTGFDTYSNVFIFFNLREVSGTFIPMCQFYSGGSLQTGTSYGLSECIDGGSVSKTNGTTKVMLDGNTTGNSSCVGYMSLYTAEDNAPSNYSCVQGQYQLGLGGTSNAPDVQVQFCAKYTTAIEGIRFTDEGSNAEFGTDSAFKMFGVTTV